MSSYVLVKPDGSRSAPNEYSAISRLAGHFPGSRIESEDELELEESGQYRLGVDGEQRSLEGFAAPVEPAPLNHTPEHPAAELVECFTNPTSSDGIAIRGTHKCAACGRTLRDERWVYSRHTGARYCTPGEGCQTPAAYAKQERARDRARKEG